MALLAVALNVKLAECLRQRMTTSSFPDRLSGEFILAVKAENAGGDVDEAACCHYHSILLMRKARLKQQRDGSENFVMLASAVRRGQLRPILD